MEKTITDAGVLSKDINISYSKDEISTKYKAKLAQVAPTMDMPGFRKGKVPSRLVERKYKDQILQELSQELMQSGYQVVQDELNSVGDIDFPDFTNVKLGSEFQFTIQTSVFPEDGLPEYKGLPYTKVVKVATDDDLNDEIGNILKSKATLSEKGEGSVSQEDDMVTYSATLNDGATEIKTVEKLPTSAKDIIISGIDLDDADKKSLLGKKVGDVVEIKGKANDHFDIEEARGKDLAIKVSVDKIEAYDTPELTDDLAKEFGLESAQDLKDKVKEQINGKFEQEALSAQKNDMFDALVESAKFELPERLLKRSLEPKEDNHHVHDENCDHDHDHDEAKGDQKAETKEVDEDAVKADLKKGLVLEMLAAKENVTVSNEDIQQQVMQMSQMYGMPPQQLMKMLDKNAIENMKIEIRNDKLLTLIADNAKLEE